MNGWDVIVVGARVSGAATAMLLARAGLRVLVIDRARRGSDTLSTHALMRGGVLQLQRWGVLAAVVASGTPPVRRIVFQYGDDEVVPVTLRPAAGVGALYAPRRTVLDTLLAEEAARAGAVVTYGTTVTGVTHEQGRVTGVRLRDHAGSTRCERAGLVVGADGRQSAVAAHVQAGVMLAGRSAGWIRYGYWADLDTDGYEWFYAPGRSAGVIPTNDGLACVFMGWPAHRTVRDGSRVPDPPRSLAHRLASARPVGRSGGRGPCQGNRGSSGRHGGLAGRSSVTPVTGTTR